MPLCRHNVGTYKKKTSSHATRQRTLGHSRLSSPSHSGLILAFKKKWNWCAPAGLHLKKEEAQPGNESSNLTQKVLASGEKPSLSQDSTQLTD